MVLASWDHFFASKQEGKSPEMSIFNYYYVDNILRNFLNFFTVVLYELVTHKSIELKHQAFILFSVT